MYVKVFGNVRVFKDDKVIVGTHIRAVTKYDEITNHLLQVCVAHCVRTKGVLTVSLSEIKSGQYRTRISKVNR